MDLSVLIPARNEMFLKQTVDDLLKNMRGDTEILVGLDGQWPVEPIPDHPKVTLVYYPESIGQRGITNKLAKISRAKYVMKLDAHCSVGEGFDVIMMEDMQDDWTMVPKMYNLHAFDWVCKECGHRRYQGPTKPCDAKDDDGVECKGEMEREIVWNAKPNPCTTSMRFDENLRFQYWGGYKKHQKGDLVETMSILGACWMLTRDKYWELEICDEGHGGWGQQGTEISAKTWLSGGRLICTKKTWFAHMFRTQGGDFSFPYKIRGSEVAKARRYSKGLFLTDSWPKAKYPLSWLIKKFNPPGWEEETNKGIIYYTSHKINMKLARVCREYIADSHLPIVSASLKPMKFGVKNVRLKEKPSPLTMFKQILAALEESDAQIVFFAEHDVLYHRSHFDFVPPKKDTFYYNTNVWRLRLTDGFTVRTDDCRQTSGLCAYRELLLDHYRKRVEMVERKLEELGEGKEFNRFIRTLGFEPGTHGRIKEFANLKSERWESECPIIDIRHAGNVTRTKWKPEQFRNKRFTKGWQEKEADDELDGWGKISDVIKLVK